MTNADQNRQIKNVCKKLGITTPNKIDRLHRYINKNYKRETINFTYAELLAVGKEFLEVD